MVERNATPVKLPQLNIFYVILGIIVLFVLVGGFTAIYQVDETEQAVVLRLGRYLKTTGPGLHTKLPFGIDQHFIVLTRRQTMSFGYGKETAGVVSRFYDRDYTGESIMLTGDLNIVDVEWDINYRVVNPKEYLFNVEDVEKTIRDISISVINEQVGNRAIFGVILDQRDEIRLQAIDRMNQYLEAYQTGVRILELQLQDTLPPQGAVLEAFKDVNSARQDMERYINEGQEEYNRIIPRAQGEARRIMQEAEGYRAERVNNARGDVARFNALLDEYTKSPDVTRTRLYIEMIETVFGSGKTTDLIDKGLSNFIPLKNLEGAN